ncbi:putative chromate transport protein [Oxobacter pfennigii]|uniref:Putative chromate transport protein n=1 Tax=Oxobacter pfennigii TaxID=36849 RepID=A0A0P8W1R7_9CLOT|nr:chromate transporter [Oxobacter pfennigii]KPU42415.1 putative chromate transport protein [Oxobacter pfennigii]
MVKLLELFMVFFKIGAFTIGGGYAMVPLVQEEICNKKKWTTEEEFLDIIAIAQSLPGVFAINTAAILGYKLFGLPGVAVACLGGVLPSFIIILTIAMFFAHFTQYRVVELIFKGVRPAVVSLLAYAVFKLGKNVGVSKFNIIIGALVVVLLLFKVHPIFIIIISGLIGVAIEYKGGKKNVGENN